MLGVDADEANDDSMFSKPLKISDDQTENVTMLCAPVSMASLCPNPSTG